VPVRIGTSGWHYQHWKGRFYPKQLAPAHWLSFYAERFATVEVNNVFYRMPEPATFDAWREQLPDGFILSVKASRYLTHIRRLHDPAQPVSLLMERVSRLGGCLGPILLQLPPNLRADEDALDATIAAFGANVRVAVEVRHPSWLCDGVRSVLEKHGAALCLVDGGPQKVPIWRTADWAYVRFHGGGGRPESCYTRSPLDTWARRLATTWTAADDVYCYFNNDAHGCAPRDARRFALATARVGLEPSRVPGSRETPVG
jgi:uncharacterized protein YecE (DUF72 family)